MYHSLKKTNFLLFFTLNIKEKINKIFVNLLCSKLGNITAIFMTFLYLKKRMSCSNKTGPTFSENHTYIYIILTISFTVMSNKHIYVRMTISLVAVPLLG